MSTSARDEHDDRRPQPAGRPAQGRADAGQQHPTAQHDAEHQFVAGEHAEQFPHERQLRQEGREAEAGDGQGK